MTRPPSGRRAAVILLALAVALAAYPAVGPWLLPGQHTFMLQKLTGIMILALMALSLDLLVGVAGLVSLGHAAFFGLGGYMLALLSPDYEAANLWLVLPASLAVVAAASALVGALAIRTSGIAFIMITLAFGQMGFHLFNDSDLAGGSDGTYIMMRPAVEAFGLTLLDLDGKLTFYYVALASLVGCFLLLRRLLASPFGRVVAAVGINEQRARALGYGASAYKLAAFTIGGTLAGLAGFLAAAQYGFVNPAMLSWHQSAQALVMVLLGGMGTLIGPVLGAFAFELARMGFQSLTEHWLLPMGGFVIAVVLALPRGLAGLLLGPGGRGDGR